MTYRFYANKRDKIALLNFIFAETDLRLFDHYSPYSHTIREYKRTADVTSTFDLNKGGQFAETFCLWSERFKNPLDFRKINLRPEHCKGHTFRYSNDTRGILLYLGGADASGLNNSQIGFQSERGALSANEGKPRELSIIAAMDWAELEKTGRKLKHQIHKKMAETTCGAAGVLPGAAILVANGATLL